MPERKNWLEPLPVTDEEYASLTPHQIAVWDLLLKLQNLKGFPDHERKMFNTVETWGKFMSLEPYRVRLNPELEQCLSPEDLEREKQPFLWKEGIAPGAWLIDRIRESYEWMPAPIVAREMYCAAGWPPLDGVQAVDLIASLPSSFRRAEREAE